MSEKIAPATALITNRLEDFAADPRVPVPAAALALDTVSVLQEPSVLIEGWLARLDHLMPSATAAKLASQERRMAERFGSPYA